MLTRLRDRFGITGFSYKWFESDLANQSQNIQVPDRTSAANAKPFGVPQGSVLGPVMFIIYTAPLGDIACRHGVNIQLYTDDRKEEDPTIHHFQFSLSKKNNPGYEAHTSLCH